MNSDAFSKWVSCASEPELLQRAGRLTATLRRPGKPALADRSREQLRQVREQLFRLERQARRQVENSTTQSSWTAICARR